jgi:hypothetical protein
MKTFVSISNLILVAFFILFVIGCITKTKDSTVLVVKKTNDFTMNGNGNAVEWSKAEYLELPKRKNGTMNYQTKMKILYSETGIYCLYECEDKIITSTIKADFEDIYNEDVVEVFFWPEESSVIYFEYELSPYNYELPILVPNYNGKFLGWRPWHYEGNKKTRHAATINKEGDKVISWTAEFFIPYKLMEPLQNMPPKKGMKWRANFYRIDYDKGTTYWSWRPTRKNFHDYESFGTIIFD